MPADFDKCMKNGGKIRTKRLGGGKYMDICLLNGKSYAGDVKEAKTDTKTSKGAFVRATEKI